MLRCPQCTHTSPLTEQAWQAYLDDHFCPPGDSRPTPSEIAVPRGRGLPLGMASPAQLLANVAATGWPPLPDSMPAPDLETMCTLLAEHLNKLKGSAFSGLDLVATEVHST